MSKLSAAKTRTYPPEVTVTSETGELVATFHGPAADARAKDYVSAENNHEDHLATEAVTA